MHDYKPETNGLPELVGVKETIALLEITKMTLGRWLLPGSGKGEGWPPTDTFMIPPRTEVGATPIWAKADVEWFAAHQGPMRPNATRGGRRSHTQKRINELEEELRRLKTDADKQAGA